MIDIFDTDAGKTDRDYSPVAKGLFHESSDIIDLFFYQAFLPRVAIWIYVHNLLVAPLLDSLALRRGEKAYGLNDIARDRIQSSRDHGEANGLDFGWRNLSSLTSFIKLITKR